MWHQWSLNNFPFTCSYSNTGKAGQFYRAVVVMKTRELELERGKNPWQISRSGGCFELLIRHERNLCLKPPLCCIFIWGVNFIFIWFQSAFRGRFCNKESILKQTHGLIWAVILKNELRELWFLYNMKNWFKCFLAFVKNIALKNPFLLDVIIFTKGLYD